MNEQEKQNSQQPSSDNFIPFTEAQLATLANRQQKYFSEARRQINYDLELAGELDDRVQSAIKAGKRVKVSQDMTGFVCE